MPDPEATPVERRDTAQSGLMEVALLHDLVCWREALARSIARNNLELKSDQITAAVNRIIFPLLLLRVAEDRHLLPEGTLSGIRDFRTVSQLISDLATYADALYASELSHAPPHQDPGNDFVVEEPVIESVLEVLLSSDRRFDCGKMTTIAISIVLMQYLARTIRRSAAHQATVVDTHDTVVSGGSVAPPLPLTEYMVKTALSSARKNRSPREIIPLRLFDPACGAGTVLLTAYRHLLDEAGGPALTFDERREILAHSVCGLDLNRHAVAATRMLLVLELYDSYDNGRGSGDFSGTCQSVLRDFRHTILCGNALVGPAIVEDESWMFCPARDRHTLNPFSHEDRFPEIAASGGFDAVVCNPPEGPLEQREWIQQYFQRRYAVYHPRIDRSAYFIEKSLSLVSPGGVVACVMSGRWLRGSAGQSLREMLGTRQIGEIVDLSTVPAGIPETGLCILRVHASPPAMPLQAVAAGVGFLDNPDAFVAAHSFPVDQHLLDAGGWALRDTRSEEILRKVDRHSTPLEDVVMGQVHAGIRIAEDSPFVVEEALAREWIRRDPRCKHLLRPIIAGNGIGRYRAGTGGKFLLLIPHGWTLTHPNAVKKSWQWLKRRHPQIARYLQPFSEQLRERAGPDGVWWETACDEFWQERRKKIIGPARFTKPAFWFDAGRGIGDEATIALPSTGLYLVGILNSRLMAFVFNSSIRQAAPGRKLFSWDDLARLPIYTPDLDRPEDRARHERMETLVRRMLDLENHGRSAQSDPERETIQKKIRATDRLIDMLVYEIYGLTTEEIAVVEAVAPS
jgi:hypothetical protein